MEKATSQATLLISIDAALSPHQHKHNGLRQLDNVVRQLLDVFTQCQFPATWALTDPASSPLSQLIRGRIPQHDIAVLGDASWVGENSGRGRLAKELQERVERSRQIGFPISTVALRGVELTSNLDLLAKHGITVLRHARPSIQQSRRLTRPQLHRFGIWQTSPTVEFPASNASLFGLQSALRSALRRAIQLQEAVHLRIDAARIVDSQRTIVNSLRKMLHAAHEQICVGSLQVKTLSRVASDMTLQSVATGSQSILRRAA